MPRKQDPCSPPAVPVDIAARARRPRQRRKEARPGEIVEAALALWAERGFAATRLEDVADRAGIAKGTIYLYFPSKEALFEAALRERIGGTVASVGERLAALDGGLETALALLLRAVYDRLLDNNSAAILKVLIGEGHRFPRLVELYREVALSQGIATVRRILERGAEQGELRLAPDAVDPRIIMAPVIAAAVWRMLFDDALPLDRQTYEAGHLDVMLRGLLAEPGGDSVAIQAEQRRGLVGSRRGF
jgi:AcrR family transcriptional regulator